MTHAYSNVFNKIYDDNTWKHGSGAGSLPAATARYRAWLKDFLRQNAVRSVVDLGCGGWQTSSLVDWTGVDYVGVDVSTTIIEANRKKHGREGVRFEVLDSYETLPSADVLIVKDVLQHLPNEDVHKVLALRQYKTIVATNCVQGARRNKDIAAGDFRPLRLTEPPFSAKATVALEYDSPWELCVEPKLDVIGALKHLCGLRAWKKEVLVIQR